MFELLSSVNGLLGSAPDWLAAVTGLVSAASAITALTPTPSDDQVVGRLYKILDLFALNIGYAKDRN